MSEHSAAKSPVERFRDAMNALPADCVSCGARMAPWSMYVCERCQGLDDENFPVILGLAIRRFVRRAEVERLVHRIVDAAGLLHRAAEGEDTGHLGPDQDFCAIQDSAALLADLALEER